MVLGWLRKKNRFALHVIDLSEDSFILYAKASELIKLNIRTNINRMPYFPSLDMMVAFVFFLQIFYPLL